jgi:hypothetical protein
MAARWEIRGRSRDADSRAETKVEVLRPSIVEGLTSEHSIDRFPALIILRIHARSD